MGDFGFWMLIIIFVLIGYREEIGQEIREGCKPTVEVVNGD